MKNEIVWCVQSRNSLWCVMMHAQSERTVDRHREKALSVLTLCRHYVTLPGGFERRQPTCKDCKVALQRKKSIKVPR